MPKTYLEIEAGRKHRPHRLFLKFDMQYLWRDKNLVNMAFVRWIFVWLFQILVEPLKDPRSSTVKRML
jgi:hypothetical protein